MRLAYILLYQKVFWQESIYKKKECIFSHLVIFKLTLAKNASQ